MPPRYSENGNTEVPSSSSWRPSNSTQDVASMATNSTHNTTTSPSERPPSTVPTTGRLVDKGRYSRAMEFAKRHGNAPGKRPSDNGRTAEDPAHTPQQEQHSQPFQAIRSPVTTIRPLKPPSQLGAVTPEETVLVVEPSSRPPRPSPSPAASSSPHRADVAKSRELSRKKSVVETSTNASSPPRGMKSPSQFRPPTPPTCPSPRPYHSIPVVTPPAPLSPSGSSFAQSSAEAVDWRRHGRQLRAQWVLEDETSGGSVFTINHANPIERYYIVAERVLEQFLSTSIRRGTTDATELQEPYLIGNRLVKFLSMVLPTHPEYFEGSPSLRLQSQEQLVRLLEYLEQLSQIIDELTYNKHTLRDLTPTEAYLVKGLTGGSNSFSNWNQPEQYLGRENLEYVRDRTDSPSTMMTPLTPIAYVDIADESVNHSTVDSVLTQSAIGPSHHEDPLEQRVAEVVSVTEAFSEAYEVTNDGGRQGKHSKLLKQTLLAAARTLHHKTSMARTPSPAHSDPSIQQISLPSIESVRRVSTNDLWDVDDFSDFDFGPADGSTVGVGRADIHSVDTSEKPSTTSKDLKFPLDLVDERGEDYPNEPVDDPSTTSCMVDFVQLPPKRHTREHADSTLTTPPSMKLADEPFENYPMDFVEESFAKEPVHTYRIHVLGQTSETKGDTEPAATALQFIPKLRDPPSGTSREARVQAASTMRFDDFDRKGHSDEQTRDTTTGRDERRSPPPRSSSSSSSSSVDDNLRVPMTTKIEERLERAAALHPLDAMDQPEIDAHFEAWRQQYERQMVLRKPTAFDYNPSNPFNDDVEISETEAKNRGLMRHFKGCVKCLLD